MSIATSHGANLPGRTAGEQVRAGYLIALQSALADDPEGDPIGQRQLAGELLGRKAEMSELQISGPAELNPDRQRVEAIGLQITSRAELVEHAYRIGVLAIEMAAVETHTTDFVRVKSAVDEMTQGSRGQVFDNKLHQLFVGSE